MTKRESQFCFEVPKYLLPVISIKKEKRRQTKNKIKRKVIERERERPCGKVRQNLRSAEQELTSLSLSERVGNSI